MTLLELKWGTLLELKHCPPAPILEVTVSTPEPLLSDTQLSESNLLTVTVETAYSVPEVWNATAGPQHSYVAALQVPLTSQKKEEVLLFSNGILKTGGEREPLPRGKKWPLGSFLAPDAQFIPGISIVKDPVNLDHNDFNTIEQLEDEIQISFHGVAYVDFAPLLYPGVTQIRGAYRIQPFSESDLLMKTKRQESVVSESVKAMIAEIYLRPSSLTPCKASSKGFGSKDSKDEMKKVPNTIFISQNKGRKEVTDNEPDSPVNIVAAQVLQQYEQMFGAAFFPGAKPLNPVNKEHRKTQLFGELNYSGKYFAFKEQMKYSVVRIVREKMLRTEAFSNPEQLQAFLSQLYIFLVDEMHVALNKTLSPEEQEIQAQPLLDCTQLRHFAKEAQLHEDYQLAAHYYQEQLAQDQNNPSNWFDYGVFYMFTAEYIKAEECFHLAVSVDQEHLHSLLMCGILSEMNSHYEKAETFFQRATCIRSSSVVSWTLLGLFYLAMENFIQAEMAFLEATKHQKSTSVFNNLEEKTETVCNNHNQSEDNEPADKPAMEGLTEAENNRQDKTQSSQKIRTEESDRTRAVSVQTFPRESQPSSRVGATIYMETVKFLLQNYALQMAQRALAQELLCPGGGQSSSYYLALAEVQLLRGEYSSAEASLQQALSVDFQNPDVWALCGHIKYIKKDINQAQVFYERTLNFKTDVSDTHPIYLHLGSIYIQKGNYDKAKITYMLACKSSPSCLTWLGLGIACYRLGELTEAEEALVEANSLNNRNSEVWGYLSLVCLQTGRKLEAEQTYKYAVKFSVSEVLLQEIIDVQTHVGFGNPSF
ncbi:Cilia- and flagella-associated protein 70 [Bagarius yarrelli]|uniref:Cilia-and flagella-associated protein 70 n=1 Tax=Bagarius yarrelli TaxID=175774 RepID=A0A556TW04_BAGYA|nr:Cilia- and flagella-associated protein 70 [Bagarius yarrelli]